MASILKVDELQGIVSAGDITVTSEGGSATQSLQQGLVKAWVNFNGTGTIAARDSLNVSSLDDNATGEYDANFSSSMDSVGYTWAISGRSGGTTPDFEANSDPTTSYLNFRAGAGTWNGSSYTAQDKTFAVVTIHGDLA